MLVRIEECENHMVLITDELEHYLGMMCFSEFVDLIDDSKEPLEENDYLYYSVDKIELNKKLNGK